MYNHDMWHQWHSLKVDDQDMYYHAMWQQDTHQRMLVKT